MEGEKRVADNFVAQSNIITIKQEKNIDDWSEASQSQYGNIDRNQQTSHKSFSDSNHSNATTNYDFNQSGNFPPYSSSAKFPSPQHPPTLSPASGPSSLTVQSSAPAMSLKDEEGRWLGKVEPAQQQLYPDISAIKTEPLDEFSLSAAGTSLLSSSSPGSTGSGMFYTNTSVSLAHSDKRLHKDPAHPIKPVTDSSNGTKRRLKNKCGVCGKGFSLAVLRKRHMKWHGRGGRARKSSKSVHRSKPFQATKGLALRSGRSKKKYSFALRKLFKSGHIRNHSKTRQVGVMSSNSSCFVCQKWFSHKVVFKLHMTRTHTAATYTPSEEFVARVLSNKNNKSSSLVTPIKPTVSSSAVNTNINRNQNGSRATKEKKYKCPLCEKSFTQSGKLSGHKKKHTGEKPFHCSVCGKDFALKDHLNIHIKIHTGEKPYPCTLCDKSFRQGGHLRMHMQTHTGEKPHRCDLCDKAYSQKGSLMGHMRTHTGEKLQHQCSMCDKSFRDSTKLNNHVRTHTGEKPFQCSLCDRAFSQSGDLVRHMRTHTGEKPYACNVCNKQFSEGSNLNKHMRTHTGYRPHECTICHKAFSEGSTLKNHLRIHSGEKPYQCSVCQKEFIQSGDLYKHMRTHTGEKPHACHLCGRAFTESSTLRKHMKTHRNDGAAGSASKSNSKRSAKLKGANFDSVGQDKNVTVAQDDGFRPMGPQNLSSHSVSYGNMNSHSINYDYDSVLQSNGAGFFDAPESQNFNTGNVKLEAMGAQNVNFNETDPKNVNLSSSVQKSDSFFDSFKALNAN